MKKIFHLTVAMLTLAINAQADVITQNVDFGTVTGDTQIYFNQFNTALGTLTDVTLSWTVNSKIVTAQVTNQNSGTVTISRIVFSNSVEGYVPSIGTDGDLVAEVAKSKTVNVSGAGSTLTNGQSYTANNVIFTGFTQTDSYTSADANFNSFKGTGSVPLFLTNSFGATVTASGSGATNTWLTSITGQTTGNLVVTYNYTAAPPIAPVPEPHSLALGFGGLLFMGGITMNSRRSKNATRTLV